MPESTEQGDQLQLGERLRQLRESNQLSQADLAGKMHLTRQTISGWERGRSLPDILNIQRLAEIYGITVDELLSGVDSNAPRLSPWRWVVLAAGCALLFFVFLDAVFGDYFDEGNLSTAVIGGADGPTAVFATHASPTVVSAFLPVAVALFAIFWMLQMKNSRHYWHYLVVAALLIVTTLPMFYYIAQLAEMLSPPVPGYMEEAGSGLPLALNLVYPGFWVPLVVGAVALVQFFRRLKRSRVDAAPK